MTTQPEFQESSQELPQASPQEVSEKIPIISLQQSLQQDKSESLIGELRSFLERSLELELVISGAVTFSLLQVPNLLETWQNALLAEYGRSALFLVIIFVVAKPLSYFLAGSLLFHLVVRSLWIGLMGVNSVYPNDPKETRTGGVFYKRLVAENSKSLTEYAASFDKIARLVFGFVFSVIFLLVVITGIVIVSFVLAFLLRATLFPSLGIFQAFPIIYGIFFLPYFVLGLLDSAITYIPALKGLQQHEGLYRVYSSVLRSYNTLLGSVSTNVSRVLANNAPRTFYTLVVLGVIAFCVSVLSDNITVFHSHPYFYESPSIYGMQRNYYENTLEDGVANQVTIQSDMLTDKYLRLFLAYNNRYADSLARHYPSVIKAPHRIWDGSSSASESLLPNEQIRASVEVVCNLYDITLNNKRLDSTALAAMKFRFYIHPKNKQKGVIGYYPADSLPTGENMLVVRNRFDTSRVRFIPFWR
jgi:hypothetical protein